jgi:UDP-N-acetylmuramate dehydrogenase
VKDVFHELEAYEIATGQLKKFNTNECRFGYRESIFKQELKGKFVITAVTLKLSKNPVLNTSYGAINDELKAKGITSAGIRDISNAVIAIRRSKLPDPKEIGNSGSFFKNPVVSKTQFEHLKSQFPAIVSYPVDGQNVKLAAGWLIENAGWKGKTITKNQGNQEIKGYGVHKNQALVLVNYGGAAGSDIYRLSEDILQSVKEQFGVLLEREVNII